MSNPKEWPLGQPVRFSGSLRRRTVYPNNTRHARKEWERQSFPARDGVYIGWRSLVDGAREWEDEVGYTFWPDEATRQAAALVVYDARRSPVLVPFDALEARRG